VTDSAQQKPAPPNSPANSPTDSATESPADSLHDFDVQKELHQKIRNDPDYDDWEYGTEPLPHEAWVASQAPKPEPPAAV